MLSFCYVDRQKSSLGSSEKSQVVHSANWKEQVHLKKELELLRRQESESIKRIASDQRMITRKFLHRIVRSIDQIKKIEKMKDEIKLVNSQRNASDEISSSETSKWTKSGEICRTRCKRTRPVTASELQGHAWERRISLMAKNIQRTKSAPNMKGRNLNTSKF